ncbi:MAG: phenylalanine--tRNA ligase subunit alpha [Thermodesulfobacteriota bacterium]|jgi:phenylalanyl-tRNA synthetase alpha chain|nr:phenylalanine--tRNA ligase subunit alpha [Candidatus Dadabacteria bacterium]MCZ6684880.1 phenylalanine--tRNA ligase subunit alpha [Candidatus Dadabacteria bacterium]MCZ6865254.1 phenylalanine--tRNA ligase subunit alpha [Candidatus Dadabacteria bacterium]
MQEKLEDLKNQAQTELEQVSDEVSLQNLKAKFVGRKGVITEITKSMKDVSSEDRPKMGMLINEVKTYIEALFDEKSNHIKEEKKKRAIAEEKIDATLPGRNVSLGARHPVSQVMEEIVTIFERMGFEVAEGPEVETDYYNFEALNIPKDHPARDMQDTFYISDDVVLRTHTSPVQIRVMEKEEPPIKIIAPGRVYRCDSDVSHTPMFHQIEGLLVDKNVTFGDLKGVLTEFLRLVFGEGLGVRFRPSFFPFTEPSAEVDIECVICGGQGCRVCKDSGWLEILGCGMVDPEVFKSVNYDPEVYSGFAFGMGIERITMLKFGINDIRLFFENDVRFLRQFV